MARSKIWLPVEQSKIPASLQGALRVLNSTSRRNWVLCEQVMVETPEASQAEILRLREINESLKKQLQLERKKPGGMLETTQQIKDHAAIYQEVKGLILRGQVVQCSKENYREYRRALQEVAANMVDTNQDVYANIALNEVRRLDRKFIVSGENDGKATDTNNA